MPCILPAAYPRYVHIIMELLCNSDVTCVCVLGSGGFIVVTIIILLYFNKHSLNDLYSTNFPNVQDIITT